MIQFQTLSTPKRDYSEVMQQFRVQALACGGEAAA
jgi:hypothetical protein